MAFSLILKRTAQVAGTAATTGIAYNVYLYNTDAGYHRVVEAYSALVPVVIHYRLAEFQHKHWKPLAVTDWECMDEQHAVPTVTKLSRLNGMYTKYCQTAAGLTNTFSDIWIREFRTLENEVPPQPVDSVRRTIEEETGRPVEETFTFLEDKPLGSASIGQVHRAILTDGREVAVKVQYPEAQELFHDDITTIRRFCEIFAPEHIVMLDALEKQNATELDYLNEARNLQEVQNNMIEFGFQPREVIIPSPIPDLCTKRLLVMELLPGPKLIDGIRDYFDRWAKDHGSTLQEMERDARDRIEREGFPAKYDGPSAWKVASYRRWLRSKDMISNIGIGLYNATIGLTTGISMAYHHSVLPPNIPRIIDTLMRVHGIQMLKYGVFTADPHGGNFLLLPDSRLGLIDYGSTKRLTRNERLSTCLLFAALYRRDEERLYDMCQVGGYKSKYGRRNVLMKLLQFGYDSYGNDVTGGKNIQQFIDELKDADPWEEVPDNFVMAQVRNPFCVLVFVLRCYRVGILTIFEYYSPGYYKFMSIRLRSLALGMNHPIRCSDWWGPMAEQILRDEGLPYESWTKEKMMEYRPELNMQRYKFA